MFVGLSSFYFQSKAFTTSQENSYDQVDDTIVNMVWLVITHSICYVGLPTLPSSCLTTVPNCHLLV